jgi:phage baseplate assembly protein W
MSTTTVYGLLPTRTVRTAELQAPYPVIKGTNYWPGNPAGGGGTTQNMSAGGGGGFFNTTSGRTRITNGIRDLLETTRGERLFLMDYGIDMVPYLFEPMTDELIYLMRDEVINGINTYFSEIVKILDIRITFSDNTKAQGVPGLIITLLLQMLETDPNTDLSDIFLTTVNL